jgi:hypothetical protein
LTEAHESAVPKPSPPAPHCTPSPLPPPPRADLLVPVGALPLAAAALLSIAATSHAAEKKCGTDVTDTNPPYDSPRRSPDLRMTHRLQPVAARVDHEGRVVIRVIDLADAGRAVVFSAVREAGFPEGVDIDAMARLEAPVPRRGVVGPAVELDGEIIAIRMVAVAALATAQPRVGFAHLRHAERGHDGIVKPLRGGDVGDRDGNVIEHVKIFRCFFDTHVVPASEPVP